MEWGGEKAMAPEPPAVTSQEVRTEGVIPEDQILNVRSRTRKRLRHDASAAGDSALTDIGDPASVGRELGFGAGRKRPHRLIGVGVYIKEEQSVRGPAVWQHDRTLSYSLGRGGTIRRYPVQV